MRDDTSWENSGKWYDHLVGEEGHYYHREVIFPKLLSKLPPEGGKVIDLGCGNGIVERILPPSWGYTGVDLSKTLVSEGKKRSKSARSAWHVADITKPLPLSSSFDLALSILALQNVEEPQKAIANASSLLANKGRLFLVINHPCFRIPRQSGWGVDEKRHLQYRRVDTYLSSLKIPIAMHPGKKEQENTFSFHFPLSSLFQWLCEANLRVVWLEEWISNKESEGKAKSQENRARKEFPLFLALAAEKSIG